MKDFAKKYKYYIIIGLIILSLFNNNTNASFNNLKESAERNVNIESYDRAIGDYNKMLEIIADNDDEGDFDLSIKDIENKISELDKKIELKNEQKQLNAQAKIEEDKEKMLAKIDDMYSEIGILLGDFELDKAEEKLAEVKLLEDKYGDDSSTKSFTSNLILEDNRKIIEKAGQKPFNSRWDNAVKEVVDYLEDSLYYPDSLEFTNWGNVRLDYEGEDFDTPVWRVTATYRAQNALGMMVTERKDFGITHNRVYIAEDY